MIGPRGKGRGCKGRLHLPIIIAKDGSVRDIQVVDGDSRLWRYKPAWKNGKSIEMLATVRDVCVEGGSLIR